MDLHAFLKSINCMPADPPKQDERRFSLKGTFQKGKEYADTQLQLIKLGVVERVSRIIARLLLDVFRAILALLVLFFLSMALGFYLSHLLGNNALGFLATAGILLGLIVVVSVLKKPLKNKIIDVSIKKILDDVDEDEEEKKRDLADAPGTVPPPGAASAGPAAAGAAAAPQETQTT